MSDFYKRISCLESELEFEKLKEEEMRKNIEENQIFKFISFGDDVELNKKKLKLLFENKLWFSYYKFFNDPNEFKIKIDYHKLKKENYGDLVNIKRSIEALPQLYDVCSFSTEYSNHMWKNYANEGNGICLIFDVIDYECLYPVIYKNKNQIDYTKILVSDLKKMGKQKVFNGEFGMHLLAILPFILKNPKNGILDSTLEKEVRALYSPFDNSSINNGVIKKEIKDSIQYQGTSLNYSFVGLRLIKIVIGDKCDLKIQSQIISFTEESSITIDTYSTL